MLDKCQESLLLCPVTLHKINFCTDDERSKNLCSVSNAVNSTSIHVAAQLMRTGNPSLLYLKIYFYKYTTNKSPNFEIMSRVTFCQIVMNS